MIKPHFNFFILIIILFLHACGGGSSKNTSDNDNGGNNTQLERGKLISAVFINSSQRFPYKVDAYKIVYETIDTRNKKINASGLLTIPKKAIAEKSPLLSYQHGTNFLDKDVPSNSASSISAIMTLSGTGYIVSSPDFIGYGESNNLIHPYLHAKSLASASVDLLRATKKFLKNKSILINSQVFLAGYSEGAYATFALQKTIQESFSNEFTITASAAGAGPFDLSETAKTLANKSINNNPSYMSFLLKAYDEIYSLNKISEMYQSTYVSRINRLFDGQHSGGEIDNNLSQETVKLFNPLFLDALRGNSTHIIKEKLVENDLYDWKPQSPTRLYHSPNDEIVPYENATKALGTMQSNGASNISLGDCSQGSHLNCAFPYVLDAIIFFSNYVDDL